MWLSFEDTCDVVDFRDCAYRVNLPYCTEYEWRWRDLQSTYRGPRSLEKLTLSIRAESSGLEVLVGGCCRVVR